VQGSSLGSVFTEMKRHRLLVAWLKGTNPKPRQFKLQLLDIYKSK